MPRSRIILLRSVQFLFERKGVLNLFTSAWYFVHIVYNYKCTHGWLEYLQLGSYFYSCGKCAACLLEQSRNYARRREISCPSDTELVTMSQTWIIAAYPVTLCVQLLHLRNSNLPFPDLSCSSVK